MYYNLLMATMVMLHGDIHAVAMVILYSNGYHGSLP